MENWENRKQTTKSYLTKRKSGKVLDVYTILYDEHAKQIGKTSNRLKKYRNCWKQTNEMPMAWA